MARGWTQAKVLHGDARASLVADYTDRMRPAGTCRLRELEKRIVRVLQGGRVAGGRWSVVKRKLSAHRSRALKRTFCMYVYVMSVLTDSRSRELRVPTFSTRSSPYFTKAGNKATTIAMPSSSDSSPSLLSCRCALRICCKGCSPGVRYGRWCI